MTETRKQRQERLMAERLRHVAHLGIVEIVRREPPHPDVSLRLSDGRIVAVEVRGLTDPERQESLSTKRRIGVATEAALNGCRVFAHVQWETGVLVPPRAVKDISEILAATVRTMITTGRKNLGDVEPLPPMLSRYVAAVTLFPPGDEPRVSVTSESWEGIGSAEIVQGALDEKEQKLASYRLAHPGGEVWLLLWTSAGEAQPLHPPMLDAGHEYASGFDRVFVLDYPRGDVTEVRLRRK